MKKAPGKLATGSPEHLKRSSKLLLAGGVAGSYRTSASSRHAFQSSRNQSHSQPTCTSGSGLKSARFVATSTLGSGPVRARRTPKASLRRTHPLPRGGTDCVQQWPLALGVVVAHGQYHLAVAGGYAVGTFDLQDVLWLRLASPDLLEGYSDIHVKIIVSEQIRRATPSTYRPA